MIRKSGRAGSTLLLAIGMVVLLTIGIIVYVQRSAQQTKNARTDRLLTQETELKRTLIGLVALEYRKFVLSGGEINQLISECSAKDANFMFWYEGEYQGTAYRVAACDNTDEVPDYTLDSDRELWFKIDATLPDDRTRTYFALLDPSFDPTPSPSPSPGVTPTIAPTKTPDVVCFHDAVTVPCPSPTPCLDGKGVVIPCPSPTPCQARDTLGLWGVVNAWVLVPCHSCTDKFGTPTACPSPTIPPPPPSPTPTPTPPPPPSPPSPPPPPPPPCFNKYCGPGFNVQPKYVDCPAIGCNCNPPFGCTGTIRYDYQVYNYSTCLTDAYGSCCGYTGTPADDPRCVGTHSYSRTADCAHTTGMSANYQKVKGSITKSCQ